MGDMSYGTSQPRHLEGGSSHVFFDFFVFAKFVGFFAFFHVSLLASTFGDAGQGDAGRWHFFLGVTVHFSAILGALRHFWLVLASFGKFCSFLAILGRFGSFLAPFWPFVGPF